MHVEKPHPLNYYLIIMLISYYKCFEKLYEARAENPNVSAVIIDGAAVVQMLKPGTAKTFQEYSEVVFRPHIA